MSRREVAQEAMEMPGSRSFARGVIASIAAAATILLAAPTLSSSDEAETGTLVVTVSGMKSDEGELVVALLDSAEMYDAGKETFRDAEAPIQGGRASVTFRDLPYGDYAIKTFHDANSNDELDTNFVGYPKESFGFSNDAMGRFGPPSFEQARFEVAAPEVKIEIHSK